VVGLRLREYEVQLASCSVTQESGQTSTLHDADRDSYEYNASYSDFGKPHLITNLDY
jgi:hypothetical protein